MSASSTERRRIRQERLNSQTDADSPTPLPFGFDYHLPRPRPLNGRPCHGTHAGTDLYPEGSGSTLEREEERGGSPESEAPAERGLGWWVSWAGTYPWRQEWVPWRGVRRAGPGSRPQRRSGPSGAPQPAACRRPAPPPSPACHWPSASRDPGKTGQQRFSQESAGCSGEEGGGGEGETEPANQSCAMITACNPFIAGHL